MTLSSFDRRDEGTYYCVSKNEMGITRGNIQVFSEFLGNGHDDEDSYHQISEKVVLHNGPW